MGRVTSYEYSNVPSDAAASAGSFGVELEHQGEATVVAASGEIDLVSEPELRERLDAALEERPSLLVVDLTAVSFVASCGLAALLRARQQAETQGAEVRLVATERAVLRPLQATGVDQVIAMFASREAALKRGAAG